MHAGANSGNLKIISLISEWSKMCVAVYLVHEALKSAAYWEWKHELSWFFACWLWCNNFWLDQHRILYLRPLNASLIRPPAVSGRILWNRVCLSFCPVTSVGVFLELDHWIYLNFGMVLENWAKWAKNRSKWFFQFKEKFGH